MNGRRPQRGLSLVELLIGITLGLMLTGAIIQLFAGTKATYLSEQSLSRVQETGRFALEFLKRDVRMAGFAGTCAGGLPTPKNHLNIGSAAYDPVIYAREPGVLGWDYPGTGDGATFHLPAIGRSTRFAAASTWTASDGAPLSTLLDDRLMPGSDVLMLTWLEPVPGIRTRAGNPVDNSGIALDAPNGLGPDAIVQITDCNVSDLFQNRTDETAARLSRGSGAGNPPGNRMAHHWSAAYQADAQVLRRRIQVYYVGRRRTGEEPSLYRMDFGIHGTQLRAADELVEGVENLQVSYGIPPPGAGGMSRFVSADAVTDWAAVSMVRLALLVRAADEDGGPPDTRRFELAGVQIDPVDDRRQRQVFQIDIGVRNAIRTF